MSFLRSEAEGRVQGGRLLQLKEFLDWEALRGVMGTLGRSGYGPTGYCPVKLLKSLILQAWHSLSDPALEEALRVRLDFMLFTGFEDAVPDETTFCRFRNLLIHKGHWHRVLQAVNEQLQARGLQGAPTQGAVLDATIITSAARPNKELEATVIDRKEDEVEAVVTSTAKLSVDPDATWLKKGSKSYFGYKGHIVTDSTHGAIHRVYVTPAHVAEVRSLKEAVGDLTPVHLYADKGLASRENRTFLKDRGTRGGIMYKAPRGRPLTTWERRANKIISKSRYIVEQSSSSSNRFPRKSKSFIQRSL